jgi:hypothetical protein
MRPLQQSEIATLSMLKDKNSKEGAYTKDIGEVLIAIIIVIEEAGHNLGQILMVVGVLDEVSLGAM